MDRGWHLCIFCLSIHMSCQVKFSLLNLVHQFSLHQVNIGKNNNNVSLHCKKEVFRNNVVFENFHAVTLL